MFMLWTEQSARRACWKPITDCRRSSQTQLVWGK